MKKKETVTDTTKIKLSVLKQVVSALQIAKNQPANYNHDHLEMAEEVLRKIKSNADYALTQLWSELEPSVRIELNSVLPEDFTSKGKITETCVHNFSMPDEIKQYIKMNIMKEQGGARIRVEDERRIQ